MNIELTQTENTTVSTFDVDPQTPIKVLQAIEEIAKIETEQNTVHEQVLQGKDTPDAVTLIATEPKIDISALVDKYRPVRKTKAKKPPQDKYVSHTPVVSDNRSAALLLKKAMVGVNYSPEYNRENEGVTHINVSSLSETKLGVFLDYYSKAEFTHLEMGSFSSLAAFEMYITSQEPVHTMRGLCWGPARHALKTAKTRKVEGLRIIIADAAWQKILSYPEMAQELSQCQLPLVGYFYLTSQIGTKTRVISREHAWYRDALNEMRNTLRKRQETGDDTIEPDFQNL